MSEEPGATRMPSDGQESYVCAGEGSLSLLEQAEEYLIWTPRVWSDNECDEATASSTDGKSSLKSTSAPASDSKSMEPQQATQVPKDLLEVIERQDMVIERLVAWCQTLEDQAVTHRMKLVEHEKDKEDYSAFKSSLRAELTVLKNSARRKAKEHSVDANVLYEKMQAKVDARVSAWCNRQEGIGNHSASPPRQSARATSSKDHQAASAGRPLSPKASTRPMTPQASSRLLQSQRGAPSGSARQTPGPRAGARPKLSAGSERRPVSPASTQRGLSPSLQRGSSDVAKAAAQSGLSRGTSPSRTDLCWERSASPEATRRSKRRSAPGGARSSSFTDLPSASPSSSISSLNPDVQRAILEAASSSSPRSSFGLRGGSATCPSATRGRPASPGGIAQQSRASLADSAKTARTVQTRKILDGPARASRPSAVSPGKCSPSTTASRSSPMDARRPSGGGQVGSGTGQTFRFTPRSVSPPAPAAEGFDRSGSPNSGQQAKRPVPGSARVLGRQPSRSPPRSTPPGHSPTRGAAGNGAQSSSRGAPTGTAGQAPGRQPAASPKSPNGPQARLPRSPGLPRCDTFPLQVAAPAPPSPPASPRKAIIRNASGTSSALGGGGGLVPVAVDRLSSNHSRMSSTTSSAQPSPHVVQGGGPTAMFGDCSRAAVTYSQAGLGGQR